MKHLVRHVVRVVAHWGLLFHIYISMAGLTAVLLFSVTGLTLNHEDFGLSQPTVTKSTIAIPADLVDRGDQAALTQHLRETLGVRSPVSDYREDPGQIQITFAAPGHRTVATVDRAHRTCDVETESRGMLGKLDDLHKGFDSGPVWYWITDLTAILLTLSALTGMVTLLSLRHRRRGGFFVAALGVASVMILYFIWIPR
jgi:hypothetical protein